MPHMTIVRTMLPLLPLHERLLTPCTTQLQKRSHELQLLEQKLMRYMIRLRVRPQQPPQNMPLPSLQTMPPCTMQLWRPSRVHLKMWKMQFQLTTRRLRQFLSSPRAHLHHSAFLLHLRARWLLPCLC